MFGTKHRRLPGRAAVVGFTDESHSTVGPTLFSKPSHGRIVAQLFGVAHQVHAVIASTGPGNGDLCKRIAVR